MWKAGGHRPGNLLFCTVLCTNSRTANPHATRVVFIKIENKCSPVTVPSLVTSKTQTFGCGHDYHIGSAANASG